MAELDSEPRAEISKRYLELQKLRLKLKVSRLRHTTTNAANKRRERVNNNNN